MTGVQTCALPISTGGLLDASNHRRERADCVQQLLDKWRLKDGWLRESSFSRHVLTTPPDKDPKTVCDKKVEQPVRGFLSKTTLQKAVGMFLLTTHTLES